MSYPETPPARLNSTSGARDFHPCFRRVGVRLDGAERTDVRQYDVASGMVETIQGKMLFGKVEPFWRWVGSRQERRARERYDAKHGVRE